MNIEISFVILNQNLKLKKTLTKKKVKKMFK